jgi:hypothetical protein
MTGPEYQDGDSIETGALYRRVPPSGGYFPRGLQDLPSNQAFRLNRPDDPGISAYLVGEATQEQVLRGHDGYALLEISVEKVAEAGFTVTYRPKAGPDERGHVMIYGNFSQGNCRKLARTCSLIVPGDPSKIGGPMS